MPLSIRMFRSFRDSMQLMRLSCAWSSCACPQTVRSSCAWPSQTVFRCYNKTIISSISFQNISAFPMEAEINSAIRGWHWGKPLWLYLGPNQHDQLDLPVSEKVNSMEDNVLEHDLDVSANVIIESEAQEQVPEHVDETLFTGALKEGNHKTSTPRKLVTCSEKGCEYTTSSKGHIWRHFSSIHKKAHQSFDTCDAKLCKPSKLRKHMRIRHETKLMYHSFHFRDRKWDVHACPDNTQYSYITTVISFATSRVRS